MKMMGIMAKNALFRTYEIIKGILLGLVILEIVSMSFLKNDFILPESSFGSDT